MSNLRTAAQFRTKWESARFRLKSSPKYVNDLPAYHQMIGTYQALIASFKEVNKITGMIPTLLEMNKTLTSAYTVNWLLAAACELSEGNDYSHLAISPVS